MTDITTIRQAKIGKAVADLQARLTELVNTYSDIALVDALGRTLNPAIRALIRALNNASSIGLRVEVRDGSGQTVLGNGTVVDYVTVYGAMTDGALHSLRLAETPFEGSRPIPDNPKILMDTGEIRYGCQVWWEPLELDQQVDPAFAQAIQE